MGRFFSDAQHPNLAAFDEELTRLLEFYTSLTERRINFERVADLGATRDKPYYGKTRIKVAHNGVFVTEMTVVVFTPGDATGSEEDYKKSQVRTGIPIPKNGLESLIPRNKSGCYEEFLFPFMSAKKDKILDGVVCLSELGFIRRIERSYVLERIAQLGIGPAAYNYAWSAETPHSPHIDVTVGYKVGSKFGDPHSVFFDSVFSNNTVQMVGFLPLRVEDEEVSRILKQINKKSR